MGLLVRSGAVFSTFNQIINIDGQDIQYTAYKLADGTINVGRIHGVE